MFGWERALGLSGAIAGVVALGAGVLALIAAVTWMVSLARRVKHGATLGDKKSGLLFGVIATVVGALATVAATSVGMARDAGFDAGIAETSAPWLLAAFTLALAAWIFATWRASARTPMA